MGARANIVCKYSDNNKIYFYSHWGGESLFQTLQDALKRGKDRWNDESYLARIIFSEMIKNETLANTGYGISPYLMDNEYPLLEVDFSKQTVNGVPFATFIVD